MLADRVDFESREVQHLPRHLRVREAERGGSLARTSTSQLMVISDDQYQSGLARIRAAAAGSSEELLLRCGFEVVRNQRVAGCLTSLAACGRSRQTKPPRLTH